MTRISLAYTKLILMNCVGAIDDKSCWSWLLVMLRRLLVRSRGFLLDNDNPRHQESLPDYGTLCCLSPRLLLSTNDRRRGPAGHALPPHAPVHIPRPAPKVSPAGTLNPSHDDPPQPGRCGPHATRVRRSLLYCLAPDGLHHPLLSHSPIHGPVLLMHGTERPQDHVESHFGCHSRISGTGHDTL